MSRKSIVELKGLLDRAFELHEKKNKTLQEITDLLNEEGYAVSKSSVQRAIRKKKLSEKAFTEQLEATKVFVEATKNTPGLQLGKAATDMLMSLILPEIQSMNDLSSLTDDQLIDKAAKIIKVQKDIALVNKEYEKGYKEGLFKAEKVMSDLQNNGVIPQELMQKIIDKMGEG